MMSRSLLCSVYDELLSGVRGMMQKMGKQYTRILLENKNVKALYDTVDELVVSV